MWLMGLIQAVRLVSPVFFCLIFRLGYTVDESITWIDLLHDSTSTSINFPFNTNQVKKSISYRNRNHAKCERKPKRSKAIKKFRRCANGLRKIYGCVKSTFKKKELVKKLVELWKSNTSWYHSPHEFSSDPSAQSFSPLQKRPRSIQFESPHAKKLSWQRGSSVTSSGFTLRSLFLSLQFLTASFQSQVCFSISK